MISVLNRIRMPQKPFSWKKLLCGAGLSLILGFALGVFSKYLDYRQAVLPYFFRRLDEALDFHNFLGGFMPWLFAGVCLSLYAASPVYAAANVFVFFAGMVSGYYLYCNFFAGFFPFSYAMIWVGFTLLSPILAAVLWYAGGVGKLAAFLRAGILAVFFNLTFFYGTWYFDLRSWLHLAFFAAVVVVFRRTFRETALTLLCGVGIAVILNAFLPRIFY